VTAAEALLAFLVAGALGFVVGLERQVSPHHEAGYAGARTFALFGMWGAAAGYLGERFGGGGIAAALLSLAGLVLASYFGSGTRSGDWGTTTEAAALLVFAAGALAWEGLWAAAIGISVTVTVLLRAKEPLHRMARQFSDEDVRTFLQFAVVTALILPLVPDVAMGPFDGFNPREVWLMVVFVSAIGLVGYVALRLLGSRGVALTGLLGGLVSSTAVTMSFSRMARDPLQPGAALATGVLAACGLMYVRVMVEAVVLAPSLAGALAPWMIATFVVVECVALAIWLRVGRRESGGTAAPEMRNPLTLTTALAFGALYAVVTFVSAAAISLVDADSLWVVGAVTGLNDVDAMTLSMGNLVQSGLAVGPAAEAVLAAVTVNAVVKMGLALIIGGAVFARRVVPALAVAVVLTAIAWVIV
jgi:uncharacterized membrane protein (DUF4010 family)